MVTSADLVAEVKLHMTSLVNAAPAAESIVTIGDFWMSDKTILEFVPNLRKGSFVQ
jgi:hypothetical protein